jgi:alginate O-acetyltransferase complex protein AlgI
MLFNSVQYFLFLPIVVALYWLLPKKARPLILLVASYYFYMSWMASYGFLLFGLTVWNYIIGLFVANPKIETRYKRLIFISGVTGNLACLCLYKYTNFLVDAFWSSSQFATSWLHMPAVTPGPAPLFNIILPLGISFFVFEFIHYLADVYKGSPALKNPINFGVFAAFFPSQIAGPIKRFQDFDKQLVNEDKHFQAAEFRAGMYLILEGLFKKVVLGDNLAQLVQAGFDAPARLGTTDAWVCVLAFTFQVYYDFSGYTDIGRGSALLLGYKLPENFNMPYISRNLTEFWKRWHISLSSWLRDYLYIPLGGSQRGPIRQIRNLIITMFLGGLWHGASWHYAVWGAYHGIGLAITHTYLKLCAKVDVLEKLRKSALGTVSGIALTFFLIAMSWVVFRAESLNAAGAIYKALFGFGLSSRHLASDPDTVTTLLFQSPVLVGFLCYAIYHGLRQTVARLAVIKESSEQPKQFNDALRWWLTPPLTAQIIAMSALCLMIVGFAPRSAIPFIYFRF